MPAESQGLVTQWLHALEHLRPAYVHGFVGLSAAIEHILPPYPGDAAVALGAAVGVARKMSIALLFAVANLGAFLGACTTYTFGRWLARAHARAHTTRWDRLRAALHPMVELVRKRGVASIAFSRFVPVGRALVIVAAGYAEMSARRALLAALVASLLWNGVLFTVGVLTGANLHRIADWLDRYNRIAGLMLLVALAGWIAKTWWQRSRAAENKAESNSKQEGS